MKNITLIAVLSAWCLPSILFVQEVNIGPKPTNNPGQWVGSDDYPPSALREGAEGVTRFKLNISKTGNVTRCSIVKSSGHTDLNSATCLNVYQRAEFSPATDESGRAIAGPYELSVRWQLPERNAGAFEPFNVTHRYTVQGDGTVTDCTTQRTGSVPTQIADCPPDFAFEPAVDEDGNPVTKKVRMYLGLEFEDAE